MAEQDTETSDIFGGETSQVRFNLMTRPGYSPYCGAENCTYSWPRTHYVRGQFSCACGWRSEFSEDFITRYEARWKS